MILFTYIRAITEPNCGQASTLSSSMARSQASSAPPPRKTTLHCTLSGITVLYSENDKTSLNAQLEQMKDDLEVAIAMIDEK